MKKNLFILYCLLLTTSIVLAQNSYTINYVENAGNPKGLNTGNDSESSGWTTILNASNTTTNTWSTSYTLPFSFEFYGINYNSIKVSKNGVLTFNNPSNTPPNNTNLPSSAISNNLICAFWEEFTINPPLGFNDIVYGKTFGTAPNRQQWIKWNSFEIGNTSYSYFAIVLEEGTNNIYIVDMNYSQSNITGTIGVQKDPSTAIQWGDSTMTFNLGGGSFVDNDYYVFTPFVIVSDDAGISKIDEPEAIGVGIQDVEVTLKNYGNNPLTSVDINWEVNGVLQTPFQWTGSINPQDSLENILIGNFNFINNSNNIKVWTSMPNGVIDNSMVNDSSMIFSSCLGYQGTFTIAPINGDFSSFNEAIDSLTLCGIAGPVLFNVADTIFHEKVVIPEIRGLSATNTLTFRGEDRDLTILRNIPTFLTVSTLHISGADYVRLENMTIMLKFNGNNSNAVLLENGANHITIESCNIKSSSSSILVKGTDIETSNNLLINNCLFDGGRLSIIGDDIYNENNTVSNSVFKEGTTFGVVCTYQKDFTFFNNTINDLIGSAIYPVLDMEYSINPNIQRNFIFNDNGDGIELNYCNDTITNPLGKAQIINNIIRCTNNYAGLRLYESKHLNFYNNTLYAWRAAMVINGNTYSDIDIRNSIIISETRQAIFSSASSTYFFNNVTANNNIYYKQNNNYGITSFGSLYTWQTASPLNNINSMEAMPLFVDIVNHDYHVLPGITVDNGDNSLNITEDFDGDPRPLPQTNIVDIGADEITNYPTDLTVASIDETIIPITVGLTDIKTTIRNLGINTITTAIINWSINDTLQSAFSWTGNLASAQTTTPILLGQGNLGYGENIIKVWVSQPNGATDNNPSNDTMTVSICSPYRGTFTVGTVTSDFWSLQEAIDRLEYCSIDSTIHLIIEADSLYGNVVIPEIAGRSASNRLIIDGVHKDSTFLICDKDCSEDGIIKILKGDYVTVQNLTLLSRKETSAKGFHLRSNADYNTITNCRLLYEGRANNASNVIGIYVYDDIFHLRVEDNEIERWHYGIRMVQALGLVFSSFNVIKNNRFKYNTNYGIHAVGQDSLQIYNNYLTDFNVTSGSSNGIELRYCSRPNIEANYIIHNERCIYLDDVNTTYPSLGRGRVVNNMMPVNNPYYTTGLELRLCTGVDIFHNTINMQYGKALKVEFSNYTDIRNNIFATNSGPAVESTYTINNTNHLDYNTYFNENDTSAIFYYGVGGSSTSYNLSGWQQQFPTWDANSVVGDPVFKDRLNGDLHVLGSVPYNTGDSTVGVIIDFDGEMRPQGSNVDMGADEYIQRINDAQLVNLLSPIDYDCTSDSIQPAIVFRNIGVNSIDTINILTILSDDNGQLLDSVTTVYYGNLNFTEYDTIALDYLDYRGGGFLTFTVIAQLNNDEFQGNDTLTSIRYLLNSEAVVAFGDSICLGEDAIITGQNVDNYFNKIEYGVYDALTGGNLLAYGDTALVPNITTDQTVFVDVYGIGQKIGYNSDSYPGLYYGTDTATMRFRLYVPTRIDTVFVNPKFGGNTVINIRNEQGVIVHTVSKHIPSPNSVYENIPVAIDALLSPGYYTMDLNGSTALQFRCVQYGYLFPYSIEGMTIMGSGGYTPFANYYHYFFDWRVTTYGVGCERPRTPVDVKVLPAPSITNIAVDTVDCFGGNNGQITVSATGGNAPLNYNWSTGGTTPAISNLPSGYVTLNVYDALGCGLSTGDTTIFIPQQDSLLALFNYRIVGCDSALISTNLSGGAGNYNLNWFNGNTSDSVLITANGNYSVTVQDANACIDTFDASFAFPLDMILAISSTPDTAETGVGTATVTPTGGLPPYSYQWNDPSMQTTQTATNLSKGAYLCEVTDSMGCTDTISVMVDFPVNTYNTFNRNNVKLFPNPTSDFVNISIHTSKATTIRMIILSIDGKIISSETFDNQEITNKTINTSNLTQGVYLLRFIIDDEVITKRLIINR